MKNWDYGGAYLRHDMSGIVDLPNLSAVKVHDITNGLPDFMRQADVLFVDPPCSTGNLRSFHTKAGQAMPYSFGDFEMALFKCIDTIAPRMVFMEVFKSNREAFEKRLAERFQSLRVYESFYYDKPANKCWIIHASHESAQELSIGGMDETRAIEWLCKHLDFECIGDLCMGRGTVGRYAHMNGRRFVGTELNAKRLAVLVEFIRSRQHGVQYALFKFHR